MVTFGDVIEEEGSGSDSELVAVPAPPAPAPPVPAPATEAPKVDGEKAGEKASSSTPNASSSTANSGVPKTVKTADGTNSGGNSNETMKIEAEKPPNPALEPEKPKPET